MNVFRKIFNSSGKGKHEFPEETDDGKIYIEGDKLICSGDHGVYSCEVNITDIQYVYVIVNQNGRSSLFLFDYHQNYIPTLFRGFQTVYKKLSAQFGFDDNVFFENVFNQEPIRKEIWRKKERATYQILKESYTDYHQGFEIQSSKKDFINWDTTYDELKTNENLYFETSPYGQQVSKFKHPIRVGNILLYDFTIYFDNRRTDVPILHFYTHCINQSSSDKSYFEIKERLLKDFSSENQTLAYERADQNSFSFNANNIIISLVYTYDSDWQFDGGYTSFSIKNQREYPELLIDSYYESVLEISDSLVINEKISTLSDYKQNENVKRRPPQLNSIVKDSPIIWVDHKNSKIGFADGQYCQVFDIANIKSITIQNILPAKGSGAGYLELNFNNDNYRKNYSVFNGECYMFDPYKNAIEKLTSLKLNIAPEYHDC